MRNFFKILLVIFVLTTFVTAFFAYKYYGKVFSKNVTVTEANQYLYISKYADFNQVVDSLKVHNQLKNVDDFIRTAKLKNYTGKIKGGKYRLKDEMTNNSLINMLRAGQQLTVNVTFNTIRTKEDLARKVSKQIEASYNDILILLNNEAFIGEFGFEPETVLSMFLPNTYEFYWASDAETFFKRMNDEYKKFWNDERLAKAEKIKLSPKEVSVLASIVQAEQSKHNDEKPKIAGLYINRLRRGIALQSDPTLVYAIGDFTIKRVLDKHKEIESPYNTYKYAGLPPGPINLPEISSLKAVLNYEKHGYIFMCAKDDFSGYHYFSKNARQHGVYARRYHAALNKRKIYR